MRFKWIRKSVKNKIIVTNILVFILFGGALLFATFFVTQSALITEKRENLKEATISEAMNVSTLLDKALLTSETRAKDNETRNILEGKAGNVDITKFLNEEKIDSTTGEVFLVNKAGKAVGSTNTGLKDKDFSNENFYPRIESGDSGISYSLDFSNRKAYFYAYSPVRSDGGEMLGSVVTLVNSDPVFESLTKTTLHDIGHLVIVDKDGVVIHSTDQKDELKSLWTNFDSEKGDIAKKYNSKDPNLESMQYEEAKSYVKNYNGAVIFDFPCREDKGENEMMAISQIDNYPLFLATEFETEKVTSSVLKGMPYLLGIGFAALVALVIVLNFFLSRILRPMKILKKVIESISRGNSEQDIPISGQDEFKELGDDISTMAKRLLEKDMVNEIRKDKRKNKD